MGVSELPSEGWIMMECRVYICLGCCYPCTPYFPRLCPRFPQSVRYNLYLLMDVSKLPSEGWIMMECRVYICLGCYYPCTPYFPRIDLRFLQLLGLWVLPLWPLLPKFFRCEVWTMISYYSSLLLTIRTSHEVYKLQLEMILNDMFYWSTM